MDINFIFSKNSLEISFNFAYISSQFLQGELCGYLIWFVPITFDNTCIIEKANLFKRCFLQILTNISIDVCKLSDFIQDCTTYYIHINFLEFWIKHTSIYLLECHHE